MGGIRDSVRAETEHPNIVWAKFARQDPIERFHSGAPDCVAEVTWHGHAGRWRHDCDDLSRGESPMNGATDLAMLNCAVMNRVMPEKYSAGERSSMRVP